MRQLVALHYPSFGGPHNLILRLHSPFAARGWETTIVLPTEQGDAVERFKAAGVDTIQVPLHRLRATVNPRMHAALAFALPLEIARLRKLIRQCHADIAVVSGLVNPHLAIAAALERVPVVWQMTDNVVPNTIRRILMRAVVRLASVIMFDGHALAQLYLDRIRADVPVFVYYPPVDCETFIPSAIRRQETRAALGIPPEAKVIGTVSNLIPLKGIVDLIRAARFIRASMEQAWFLVVGAALPTHDRYLFQIRDEIAGSGVPPERFVFTGGRSDVERFYPAMDVSVIASHTESTTTTAMEAMACGIPVVATDVGGVHEVVRAGETGWLVPPRDPSSISEACLRLLQNIPHAQRMAARAREVAKKEFDVPTCLERQLDAYRTATALAGGRRLPELWS